ncbi:hypothetical protein [Streptomyces hoynatensis]|uniref:VWA domain-containing protein n=1 Tax=Streptomyces hoynatensis TaxID=1141874 RepID=A0A3A9ZFX8_9ACTN|nr:hypothetical protein [Streptomyces hoynatensis]RKN46694.1 hypothetical protein D7294_00215 [Streptomyces hoynatensis]
MRHPLVAALLAAAALAATGCDQLGQALGTDVDRYTTACAVLVDGSGSGQEDAAHGFAAEEKLNVALPEFLRDLECRTLAFAPITRASAGSTCQQETLDLDPDARSTDDRDQLREVWRSVALDQARELLSCARNRQPGSDVLGALDRVGQAAPDGAEAFHILVVSDFMQADGSFQLHADQVQTPESRAGALDTLEAQGRLPRLPETTTVYPAGYGMRFSDDPAAYEGFDAFWSELLEERVKIDVSFDYRQ